MKNFVNYFLLLSIVMISCSSNDNYSNQFITDFFNSNASYTCTDSTTGKFQLRFKHQQINMETMSFEFVVPDSIQFSDFYNAYIGRIVNTYYKSIAGQKNKAIDSLFRSPECSAEEVKKKTIEYFSNDPVFSGVFNTALSGYYRNIENFPKNMNIEKIQKINYSIDSLVQIGLLQFDVVDYDPERGFAYHFVCGVNPYKYSIENKVNLLIPGFCQEALRTKEMYEIHSKIMHELTERMRQNDEYSPDMKKEICDKYQDELHKRLIQDGTLKKSLLNYYAERKEIEPFILIN